MRHNFDKNLDLDEVVAFFKNTKIKQPLLSFQLCDLPIKKRDVIKRKGILSRYDNVWVNTYDSFIEVCAYLKKDDNAVYSALLEKKCEDSLINRIRFDEKFGKEKYGSIIYGKKPTDCNEKNHYHYEELLAQKEFSQRKNSNGYLEYDKEIIECPTHKDGIELKKTKTDDGIIKFELIYHFDKNDNKNKILQYVWPENSFQSFFSELGLNKNETTIFELKINKDEEVLNFNYCGEGFFVPNNSLNKLIYFKEYKQSLTEFDSNQLLRSSEYKKNIEIGTIIYKTLKGELQ